MSSDSSSDTSIRYAPYIESKHEAFLNAIQAQRISAVSDSPFSDFESIEIDDAFFGANYVISSFPSLYDMYGKFMAGLDVDTLYTQTLEDSVNAPEINNLVAAEAALMDDDIAANALAELYVGARDINAIHGDSFITSKALILDGRNKSLSKFSSQLKERMLKVTLSRWQTHLQWNADVISKYSSIMQLFFSAKMDVEKFNYNMLSSDKLWPFTVMEYERAALGALQGATNSKTSEEKGWLSTTMGIVSLVGSIAALL